LPADAGQLTRTGFRSASPDNLESLRQACADAPCVRLSRFLEPWLRHRWGAALDAAPFKPRIHHDSAYWGGTPPPNDLALDAPDLLGEMLFLMNDPALFRVVEQIAGCEPIGSFKGIVYRFVPGQGHSDRWHSDMDGNRLVAISVNMGREPFAGGRLQIADASLARVLCDEANREQGDAFLFRISDDLKHHVSEVEAGPARTVFTGWFVRRPSLPEWLRGVDVKDV
jgi:hypothetical protein